MANDIETVCKRMVADANSQLEKYEKDQTTQAQRQALLEHGAAQESGLGNAEARVT